MDVRHLEPLLAHKTRYLSTWRRGCEAEAPPARLDEIFQAFDREIDHIGALPSERLLASALRATGSSLAQRGVPLATLLAASAHAGHAAIETLGEGASAGVLRALNELEAQRAATYLRAYETQDEAPRPRCTRALLAGAERVASTAGYGIVGRSAATMHLRRSVEAAARGPSTILVTGESGSGKELVARAIHAASGSGKFVALSCATLPSHLVESELFGHVRGAIPGAATDHTGLLVAANGGTLFLDEVTEMSPEIQAKLLRVLEERTVRPVGSLEETAVDARIVASTQKDPLASIDSHRLRADLFYRLQGYCITVPPLRDRREDIPLLAEHFLATFCNRKSGCIWAVSDAAMAALVAADWPGNVRELRNAIEHAITTGSSDVIDVTDLPPHLAHHVPRRSEGVSAAAVHLPSLAEAEIDLIRATLERCGGNKLRAAASLGISRHKLYDRLRRM